jgi:hypothetical protein
MASILMLKSGTIVHTLHICAGIIPSHFKLNLDLKRNRDLNKKDLKRKRARENP